MKNWFRKTPEKKTKDHAPGEGAEKEHNISSLYEIVEDHLKDAIDKGARVLTGGERREGPGDYFEPTVLVDVDHTMKVMQEETFGPLIPVMKVGDENEAVRLANDSRYGLSASVFGEKWGKKLAIDFGSTRKSLAGSSAMFVFAFLAIFLATHIFAAQNPLFLPGYSLEQNLLYCALTALVATAVEFIPSRGFDNLFVPIISGLVYYLLNTGII